MKTIFMPEHQLRHLFSSLNLSEDSHAVLNNIILRYDHDYAKFIYGVFSAYNKVCISLMDEHCEVSRDEVRNSIQRLTALRREINPASIFVADKFDLLYGVSCTGDTRNEKFKDFMYEDMYSRLENLYGVQAAPQFMEDVFESIEFVIGHIEGNLIGISQSLDDSHGNLTFYLDVYHEGLLFIII